MPFDFPFFLNSLLLGVGLSMDAFSISLANGLSDSKMRFHKACLIAGVFAFSQAAMPMIGWICVSTVAKQFTFFNQLIPWIALILLCYLGGNMLYDSFKTNSCNAPAKKLSFGLLIVQGIATSIDALSVGFTIARYNLIMAIVASLIIALVTFILCLSGVYIGKRFGTCLASKAGILGGAILIIIGIKIFIEGIM